VAEEYRPIIRLVGEVHLGSQEWDLAQYRSLFEKLNALAPQGRLTRFMRYSGETAGQTVMRFLGVETDTSRVPEGMTALIADERKFTVLQTIDGDPVVLWNGDLTVEWLDRSVPDRALGEVSVILPSGWTGDIGRQPVTCICTANAYFQKGRIADDDVRIAEYDPQWPSRYEEITAKLRKDLPPDILLGLEHFGSTAVPGLPAKPVIDILMDIPSLKEARRVLIPYFNRPECEYWMQEEDMCFILRKELAGTRLCHIHAVPRRSPYWKRLAFRDHLRTHKDDARRYAELKRGLAGKYAADREEYTIAKGDFIDEITARALGER
jgi:GrpB-like predicted nucleotidyltransferase (UPF0157 family)